MYDKAIISRMATIRLVVDDGITLTIGPCDEYDGKWEWFWVDPKRPHDLYGWRGNYDTIGQALNEGLDAIARLWLDKPTSLC